MVTPHHRRFVSPERRWRHGDLRYAPAVRFLGLSILLACSGSRPTERVSVVERPAVAVVVPLTGQHAGIGQGAVQGVMLAMDDAYEVTPIDEASGDPVGAVKAGRTVKVAIDAKLAGLFLDQYLIAVLDAKNAVRETVEQNNQAITGPID